MSKFVNFLCEVKCSDGWERGKNGKRGCGLYIRKVTITVNKFFMTHHTLLVTLSHQNSLQPIENVMSKTLSELKTK